MKLNLDLDLEDLAVNGDLSPGERVRIVRSLTDLPWAVYLKKGRFRAKRYGDREGCVTLAISKAMAKHLAEIFNEELEEARAMVRAAREARRSK